MHEEPNNEGPTRRSETTPLGSRGTETTSVRLDSLGIEWLEQPNERVGRQPEGAGPAAGRVDLESRLGAPFSV